jgi:hypothetical protein
MQGAKSISAILILKLKFLEFRELVLVALRPTDILLLRSALAAALRFLASNALR